MPIVQLPQQNFLVGHIILYKWEERITKQCARYSHCICYILFWELSDFSKSRCVREECVCLCFSCFI